MSQNRLPLLFSALIVLLVVAYVTGVFEGNPSTIDAPEIEVPVERVDRIEITHPFILTVTRDGSHWRIEAPIRAEADSTTVSLLLESLRDLEVGSVVSTNPERYGRYGVDSTAVQVTLHWNGDSIGLAIASEGPDFQSSYLRVIGDPAVYSTRSRIPVPTDPDRWRDRTMLTDIPVTGAGVTGPDMAYAVAPAPGGWSLTVDGSEAVPADSAAVSRWLGRFRSMKADGFLTDVSPDSVRAGATHAVSLSLAGGSDVVLYLEERDGALAAVVGDGTDVYRLFATRLRSLVPESSTLASD